MGSLKELLATRPEPKKMPALPARELNEVQEDWTSFCKNYAMRVALLPENARDNIRMEMERVYWDNKLAKSA